MIPGDLVKNLCFLDFYPTAEHVNQRLPDDGIPMNSIGMIVKPPDGTWVKWLVNGRVGWSNWTFMQVVE